MDLFTIAGACLRRWYLTVPMLLIVALFSFRAYAGVEPLYSSSRSIVVLPSLEQQESAAEEMLGEDGEDTDPSDDDNPYSGQGGSRFAVAVLKRNINSTSFEERLDLDEDVDQTFEAESSSEQPMIHVTATAPSEEGVHELLDGVVEESGVVLNEFQADAGAPQVTRYRIAPAVPAGPVEDATPSRLRAAGAIAVLGGGLVAGVVVGLDALLTSRRRRRDEGSVPADSAPREPSPPEDEADPDPPGGGRPGGDVEEEPVRRHPDRVEVSSPEERVPTGIRD